MKLELRHDYNYIKWLADIKAKVRNAQIKAAVKVNTELLLLYWNIGADIVQKQKHAKWGARFLPRLSKDLLKEFPDMKGFSLSNLKYIRQWYLFYSKNNVISQQVVGQFEKQHIEPLTQGPVWKKEKGQRGYF